MAKIFFVAFTFSLLAACADNQVYVWSKPGATEQDFKRSVYECKKDALSLPYAPRSYRPAFYPNNVWGNLAQAGDDLQDTGFDAIEQSKRIKLIEECLESKGWTKRPKK